MEYIGIIVTQSHDIYTVCPENDRSRMLTARVSGRMRHELQQPAEFPAVGDSVLLDWDGRSDSAVIRSLMPRRSCLNRVGDMNTQASQVIAANLDALMICTSLNQNYSIRRMERYLAAARASGVEPLLVLTKADLSADPEARRSEVQAAFPGVTVLLSAPDVPEAARHIRGLLEKGKFVAFAGSSGVGKSTLVNAVLEKEQMHTSAIREDDGRGRHTTTHRQLIFAHGGAVIDTPGMRAFALDDADVDDVFGHIAEIARSCRFSDCGHDREPGCAVREAVRRGDIAQDQLQSYLRLKRESQRRKSDKRLRKK